METHAPHYYSSFRCLAGDCPHTCCAAGWQVPIDPETAALYQTLPTELGQELRAAVHHDPEGQPCLLLRDGCPFLTESGLCRVHMELGEQATPLICRTHPRFCYEYGTLREKGLCGSCPEAVRLILEQELTLTSTQEPGTTGDEPLLLSPLLTARGTALSLLGVENASLSQRLQALLLFANEVQVLLDEDQADAIPRLCQVYLKEFPLLDSAALPSGSHSLELALDILDGLDILHPLWRDLLTAARKHLNAPLPAPTPQHSRAASYFLYRHWLRGVWDSDVLSWAEFAVLGTALCRFLSPFHEEGFPEVFRLFCEELEHSESNMTALQDALWDKVSLPEMLSLANL